MPSPTSINRRAKEYGNKLKQFLPDCVADIDADGTKCRYFPIGLSSGAKALL